MTYSHLEDYIFNLYKEIGITTPEQIKLAEIAQKIGIKIHYSNYSLRYDNYIVIKQSTKQKEWQDFGHEVCHYLIHEGNHLNMFPMFRDFQEWQANLFAYHFCVPTFMLDRVKVKTIYDIIDLFNVESPFAEKRLELYQNKLYRRMMISGKRVLQA